MKNLHDIPNTRRPISDFPDFSSFFRDNYSRTQRNFGYPTILPNNNRERVDILYERVLREVQELRHEMRRLNQPERPTWQANPNPDRLGQ